MKPRHWVLVGIAFGLVACGSDESTPKDGGSGGTLAGNGGRASGAGTSNAGSGNSGGTHAGTSGMSGSGGGGSPGSDLAGSGPLGGAEAGGVDHGASSAGASGTAGADGSGAEGGAAPGSPVVPNDDPSNPNLTHPACGVGQCLDFPSVPIVGDGVPPNAAELFGAGEAFDPGLCVLEPTLSGGGVPGAMIPANWLRPRFRFDGAGLDLFEIRIHNAAERYDLVAYTRKTTWYVPQEIWSGPVGKKGAAYNGAGAPFSVTIRGINRFAPATPVGVSGSFEVAPVLASGSILFWSADSATPRPDSGELHGFSIGEEAVAPALTLGKLSWTGQPAENGAVLRGFYDKPKLSGFTDGQVRCIGCHAPTPDGTSLVFTDDFPWSKGAALLSASSAGQIPKVVSPGAQALMKMPWWGAQTMSAAHWVAGDRVLVTSYGVKTNYGAVRDKPWYSPDYAAHSDVTVSQHQLAWIDLETTANINVSVTDTEDFGAALSDRNAAASAARGSGWGLIATGDTDSAVSPNLSHAGDKIVYTTTNFSPDGHPDYMATRADLRVVPYNNRAGGTAVSLVGAADPSYLEYYPSFSPDDRWVAFTRAPTPSSASPDGPYYNRFGEIALVSAQGGTLTRLIANDPNTCGSAPLSQGSINSWPQWAPQAVSAHGKTYYFVIFTSARPYADEFAQQFNVTQTSARAFKGLALSSQVWLATVVEDNASGNLTTYPAHHLWNQNRLVAGDGTASSTRLSHLTPSWQASALPPISAPPLGE